MSRFCVVGLLDRGVVSGLGAGFERFLSTTAASRLWSFNRGGRFRHPRGTVGPTPSTAESGRGRTARLRRFGRCEPHSRNGWHRLPEGDRHLGGHAGQISQFSKRLPCGIIKPLGKQIGGSACGYQNLPQLVILTKIQLQSVLTISYASSAQGVMAPSSGSARVRDANGARADEVHASCRRTWRGCRRGCAPRGTVR